VTYLRTWFARALLAAVWLLPVQSGAVLALGQSHFEAAHFDHDAVYVFPDGGQEFSLRLPPDVPAAANLIGFASSGRSAYVQIPSAAVLHLSDELIQVDFSPLRLFSIPGSGGLGEIISVASSLSGSLLVTTAYGQQGLCGAYEIDASHGRRRPILTVPARPDCRFGPMQVNPDGKHVLVADNLSVKVVDVATGAVTLSGIFGRGGWSPDGNWLAFWREGEITLFDGRTFLKRRRFRASSVDGHLVWSPDSKRILFVQKELRCFLRGDYESIALLDIETGKKSVISSSHCAVTNSQMGWIDVEGLSGAPIAKN
jgi:hypothetical protein